MTEREAPSPPDWGTLVREELELELDLPPGVGPDHSVIVLRFSAGERVSLAQLNALAERLVASPEQLVFHPYSMHGDATLILKLPSTL